MNSTRERISNETPHTHAPKCPTDHGVWLWLQQDYVCKLVMFGWLVGWLVGNLVFVIRPQAAVM